MMMTSIKVRRSETSLSPSNTELQFHALVPRVDSPHPIVVAGSCSIDEMLSICHTPIPLSDYTRPYIAISLSHPEDRLGVVTGRGFVEPDFYTIEVHFDYFG